METGIGNQQSGTWHPAYNIKQLIAMGAFLGNDK